MTQKTYRSAQGKSVDMGSLLLRNENTRAVGNMNVNARGDQVDPANRPVRKKTHSATSAYKKQVRRKNVSETTDVPTSRPATPAPVVNDVASPEAVVSSALEETGNTITNEESNNMSLAPVEEAVEAVQEEVSEAVHEEEVVQPKKTKTRHGKKKMPEGGLAGALAKAKEVSQTKVKPAGSYDSLKKI